ncbi:MAG TPA: YhdP family protein, partial [Gallionellaceae bacterium]|nr:YhdP family protein [Gallionellaceae bacterium]
GVMLLLFASAGALLLSRYWLLPGIEHFHDPITFAVSNAIGQPATIGRIEADWHGLRPHLLLVNVRILDRQGLTALALERVESEVSWTSLLAGEVRLYSLMLDQPDLFIKRNAHGQLFVAGMPLSGATSGGGSADWLLNQSRIEVRNARITWLDEQRAALPLVFNEVNLLIDNGWRSHRFALRALPPQELSAQLDVRGEFRGASFDDMSAWDGQLFTQLDYADVAAWRTWLPLPVPLSSGKGALRGWMDVERGKISRVTADLALSGVRTRLADDLPVLDLRTLHGRIGWRDVEHGIELSTQGLSLRLRNDFVLPSTDFYLHFAAAQDQQPASGEVRANKLDLLGLSTLSEYLPFNRSFKRKLSAFAPHGLVSDLHASWQGDADKLMHYKLKASFDGLAMSQVSGMPGFSGLTGKVDGSDDSGTLSLNSRKLTVDAPGIMEEKLLFDTLTAQIGWQSGLRGMEIKFNDVAVANADMNGALYGSYHTASDSPGVVDITAHLTRAAVRHVDRYIPINALGKEAHEWLSSGLAGGQSDDANLRLVGNLNNFPFPENKDGMFQIRARFRDATVEFLKEWPRIEDMNGELLIEGKRLELTVPSATTAGNALQKVSAVFPDLVSPDLLLQIYGESAGETARALGYIRKSPVRGYLGGFTDNATTRGNGELKLQLDIPLLGSKPVKVNGSYRFEGNDVDLGGGIPLLQETSGDLLFSESSVSTHNLAAKILGGPAALEVKSSEYGRVILVKASGNADMDALRNSSTLPLLRYLHGGSPWELQVTVQNKQADTLFTSDLVGLVSDLPAPFSKRTDEKVQLRFVQKILDGQQDVLSLQYGELLNAQLSRYKEAGRWKVRRGTVGFGMQKKWPEREGLWLAGEIPHLSLEGWEPLLEMVGGKGDSGFGGADVLIRKVTGYGQTTDKLRVSAHSRDNMLFAQLASKEINGDVIWQPQDKGALVVRLKNLALSGGGNVNSGAGKPVAVTETEGRESPEIHFSADNFSYHGKQLGKLEMQAKQLAGNWLLERLLLTNPDGVLTADGKWLAAGTAPQTQVNFKLEISDAGKILSRYGYPDSVKNGGGKLEGALSWYGNPDEFNYAALGGTLKLDVGKGQFMKIDPGAGKLLSILNLQALPTHISLD